MTQVHDAGGASTHAAEVAAGRAPPLIDPVRVVLVRSARETLSRLDADRRAALEAGFRRVGRELVTSADRVSVAAHWARGTWPQRRYPQQCYAKTVKYILEHVDISGMRLVHGVVSHAPHFTALDHAWVDLPGETVFDAVVQEFFTRASYRAVMAAVALDSYSAAETQRLLLERGHPGPWNAKWVPTARQLAEYAALARGLRQ